jgi:hypothetical protein
MTIKGDTNFKSLIFDANVMAASVKRTVFFITHLENDSQDQSGSEINPFFRAGRRRSALLVKGANMKVKNKKRGHGRRPVRLPLELKLVRSGKNPKRDSENWLLNKMR